MNTIAIIPARGGSKRLPNKNIKQLAGVPLLEHSVNYARRNTQIIDDVFVSTDSEAIASISTSLGAKVIERPAALSGDMATTVSALKHALTSIKKSVENVVLLQATNPLRPVNLLKDAWAAYSVDGCDSLITVSRLKHKKLGQLNASSFRAFNYKFGQRSQDIAPLYYENGLLYIAKAGLIRQGILLGPKHTAFVVDHPFAEVDIDTQEDLTLAEYILKTYA